MTVPTTLNPVAVLVAMIHQFKIGAALMCKDSAQWDNSP